jgi:hypothetical protein
VTAVDVGDAFELTFRTATGATVTASWYDNNLNPVYEGDPVTENPAGSGLFPRTLVCTAPGMWKALFTASGAATAVEEEWVRATSVTGPPPLAAVGDVSAQFGVLSDAQTGLARYLLRAASKLVRRAFPAVDADMASGAIDPDIVALSVTNMALRVLRNPQGLRAQTIGPFSYTYDTTVAAGLLVLSESETAALTLPAVQANSMAAMGTVRIHPGMAPPVRHRGGRGWGC